MATGSSRSNLAAPADRAPLPGDAAGCIALSATLYGQGRVHEAMGVVMHGLSLAPENATEQAELLNHRGVLAARLGDAATAEAAYRRAMALQPGDPFIPYNLGNLLKGQKRLPQAEELYRRTLSLKPDYAEAWSNLGELLRVQQRLQEAEAAYRRAIAASPRYAVAHTNLGNVLQEQRRDEEAEAAYGRAIEVNPRYARAHCNLGVLLKSQQRIAEAEAAYHAALRVDPGDAATYSNLGVLLLGRGRYAEGWSHYEARYAIARRDGKMAPPPVSPGGPPLPPPWRGEALAGKSVLIWAEQGLGDEIQFVRYLPLIRARGARHITLFCKPPLKELFQAQSLADRVICDWHPEWAAQFDSWSYLLSLPLHLGNTLQNLPATLPYLIAPAQRIARWQTRLSKTGLRVGLVWKGSPTNGNDTSRSLPSLTTLAPLWSVPGIRFVSLQKGTGEDEAAAPPAGQPLTHLGGELADFADSAAVLGELDLLISVDTAMAHLAGALGRPCWVLLPHYKPDWRWLEEREDSPWYPKVMRLYRQKTDGDWDEVVRRVVGDLGARSVNQRR